MHKSHLLKYIQLYSGCSDVSLKRISNLIDEYTKANPTIKKQVVKEYVDRVIIKDRFDKVVELLPISQYLQEYCLANDLNIADLKSKRRSRDLVRLRRDYAMKCYQMGYTMPEIAKSINRDHSTIVHYFYHYKI